VTILATNTEDLGLFLSDKGLPIIRIDAKGWLDLEDMKRLRDFLNDAIARRSPSSEENNYEPIIRK
jgi:hypothetical protein